MKSIYSSATKLVLLLLTVVLCAGVLWKPDIFFKTFDYAVVAVIAFYFGQKTRQDITG